MNTLPPESEIVVRRTTTYIKGIYYVLAKAPVHGFLNKFNNRFITQLTIRADTYAEAVTKAEELVVEEYTITKYPWQDNDG